MRVRNLHYQSTNDAVSDPNVTSLFLTLTAPTTVKANYGLENSQETVRRAQLLGFSITSLGDSPTRACGPSWAAGPSLRAGTFRVSRLLDAILDAWQSRGAPAPGRPKSFPFRDTRDLFQMLVHRQASWAELGCVSGSSRELARAERGPRAPGRE